MKRLFTALAASAVIALSLVGSTFATQPDENGEHKIGICHRTASDTNPYVFIEVDVAAGDTDEGLSDHLGNNDTGHKPTFWKSDGTFRGVPHVDGGPKDDYLAASAADCEEVTPSPSPTPTTTPSATPSPSPTPTPTATPSATPTPFDTPIPTLTPAPTITPSAPPVESPTPIATLAPPEPTLPPTDMVLTEGPTPDALPVILFGLIAIAVAGAGEVILHRRRTRSR